MTHAKAASLTSALFAKKGTASPANLLIAELDEDAEDEASLPRTAVRGRGKAASQRRKASLPEVEQELPLLAFVDAQIAGDDASKAESDAAVAEVATAPNLKPAEGAKEIDPRPAASLLAGRSFALWVENRSPAAGDATDQEAESPVSEARAEANDDGAKESPILDAETRLEQSQGGEPRQTEGEVPQPEVSPTNEEAAAEPDAAAAPGKQREAEKEPRSNDIAAADIVKVQSETAPESKAEPVSETEPESVAEPESDVAPQAESAPATLERSDQSSPKPSSPEAGPAAEQSAADSPKTPEKAPKGPAPAAKRLLPDLADLQAGERRPVVSGPTAAGVWIPKQLQGHPWAMAAVVLLGTALGFGGYALWPSDPAPTGEPAASEDQASPVQAADGSTSEGVAASAEEAQATDGDTTLAPAPELMAVPDLPETADAPSSDHDGLGSGDPAGPEPSFDIIRIEPNGQSIIAGRADPHSEWILLNNGEPIGSVMADANGEWVILPEQALVPGANAFSLVPKAERGRVAIPGGGAADREVPEQDPIPPQSDADGVGGSDRAIQPAGDTPLPRMKPAETSRGWSLSEQIQVVAAGGYEIQFASVRENTAAEQERLRLIAAYPDLLADLALQVKEASIQGAGVFYRLRSGPIEDLGRARELCRRLERQGQGCLVVMRSEPLPPVSLPEPKPSNALSPALAPTQQAERPE